MTRSVALVAFLAFGFVAAVRSAEEPPNGGRGAGTVPLWNPHHPEPGNSPLEVRVLVLVYDPIAGTEGYHHLSEVFHWNNPARMVNDYKEQIEYAAGGYLHFDIVEWRNLNEIYAKEDGYRYGVAEYIRNRRNRSGWGKHGTADYPRLLREQNVVPLVESGLVDEVWIFSDHFFGLWEWSMAGRGAFYINGGVYPQVPSRRPFAFAAHNYERDENLHTTSHRAEATMNRVYGDWNLRAPENNWEKFSANDRQSDGVAGVGTCHWPANAVADYDYGNPRVVGSWADAFLNYPKLELIRKPTSRDTWSKGGNYEADYLKWYFAHFPRAAGVNADGRQNNWFKYVWDYDCYDAKGSVLPPTAQLYSRDVADPASSVHLLGVAYRSADQIDPETLGDADLAVTTPDGKPLVVKLISGNEPGFRSYRFVRYQVAAPSGRWVSSPSGLYTVSLRPDRIRTRTGTVLPGQPLGTFGIARAASGPEPLSADFDTTLLLHFEGNTIATNRTAPTLAKGLRYRPGLIGKGILLEKESGLRYSTRGVIGPKAGTLEFWVRPTWPGNVGQHHTFFQAGEVRNNGMMITVDSANNLRFLTWGDDPATPTIETKVERQAIISTAGWKAGQWHHIAATWDNFCRSLALYVDGQLVDQNSNGAIIRRLSTQSFRLGSGMNGVESAEAVLDEVRISRRVRTPTEIRASAAAVESAVASLRLDLPPEPLLVGGRSVIRAFGRNDSETLVEMTRDVAWSSSDSSVATVDPDGNVRAEKVGRTVVTARYGSLKASANVQVADPDLPRGRVVEVHDVTEPGSEDVRLIISFHGVNDIRLETVAVGNVRVVGPGGFSEFPEVAWVKPTAAGAMAEYRVKRLNGKWTAAERGEYRIELKAFQVGDKKGNFAPETVLGRFRISP